RRAAAEEPGLLLRDERPGDGFQHATSGKRPPGGTAADLQCRQDTAVDRTEVFNRLRRDLVDAMDAHDLFHEIGLAIDIRAPGRHGNGEAAAFALYLEAEARENFPAFIGRDVEAGQALVLRGRRVGHFGLVALVADALGVCCRAAAKLQHEFGRALWTGNHVFRVDTALEAVAGIGDDA